MAKELVLDVVARKSSKDLLLLAQEFENLSHEIDGANKSAQQNVKFSKFLDDQIAETRKQVQSLTEELNKTGSADTFGQLRGAQRNLNVLERYRKQIGDVGDAEEKTTEKSGELNKEFSETEAVLRALSNEYQDLGADVRRLEGDYKNLTERVKTQSETVRNLKRDSQTFTNVPFNVRYYEQARSALEDLREEAADLRLVLKSAPDDASKRFESFDEYVKARVAGQRSLINSLRQDLFKTGNFNVLKDIQTELPDLKKLEAFAKDIGITVESGIEQGGQEGVQFLGKAFGSLPPEAQAGIAAGIASAVALGAPVIGAAISGALLTGVGLAGVGIAVASQIKSNPAVASAFKDLGSELKLDLASATSDFAPVLIQGAHEFGDTFRQIEPVLKAGFDALVVPAERLINGIEGFVKNGAPGFSEALKGAGIVLDEIAADLPGLGRDFGEMFALIGRGGPGGADAIGKIIHAVGILAVATGAELDLLSKVFTALEISADLAAGKFQAAAVHMAELNGGFHDGADAANRLNGQIGNLGNTAGGTAAQIDALNKSIDDFIGKNLSADQAAVQYQQALTDLSATFQKNNNDWRDNTDAGLANQQALLGAIQAAEQKRIADVNNGKDALQAAQDYNTEVQALLNIAGQAGDSKAALDKLKGKYEIDVQEYYTTHFINEGTPPSQFFHGLAGGGPVVAGQPYIVGENGPELFMSDTSGQIIPNDKLGSLMNLGSSPSGFRATSPASSGTTVTFAGNLDSAFATAFQYLVRTGQIQIS